MAPHLDNGSQVVFLAPGTFGSYAMAQIVREHGNPSEIAWAETGAPALPRAQARRARGATSPCARCACPPACIRRASPSHALAVIRRGLSERARLRRRALGRADECRARHPPAADGDERGTAAALRALGHPQRRHPACRARRDRPPRPRTHRGARGASAMRRRTTRSPTTTPTIAGCTATRTSAWSTPATGARPSTCTSIATSPKTPSSAWPSSRRWRAGAGTEAPIAQGLLAIVGAFLGRDLRRGPRTLEALGLATLSRAMLAERLDRGH